VVQKVQEVERVVQEVQEVDRVVQEVQEVHSEIVEAQEVVEAEEDDCRASTSGLIGK
jgi:hypothetical protein